MSESDVHDWVGTLPFKMQAVLLCSLRGPDGFPKESPAKPLVRAMRAVILKPAGKPGPNNQFMYAASGAADVARFLDDIDPYNVHWILHFAHAAEIIGVLHPEPVVANFWGDVYQGIVERFHMNPESRLQLFDRLGLPGGGYGYE